MPDLDLSSLQLLVAAVNTVGVILMLGYGLRAFLQRRLITQAELVERLAREEAERLRLEADRNAWRAVAEAATLNGSRLAEQFEAAIALLREKA